MTFRIVEPKDGSNVYGDVDEKNAVFQQIEKCEKPLAQMDVGEGQTCSFRASGTKGMYRVLRIS